MLFVILASKSDFPASCLGPEVCISGFSPRYRPFSAACLAPAASFSAVPLKFSRVGCSRAEEPLVTSFFKTNGKIIPQRLAAGLDLWFNALHHSLVADAVFAPALSLICKIEKPRHRSIDRMCEAGLRSVPIPELKPQSQESGALRIGKYSKYPRD